MPPKNKGKGEKPAKPKAPIIINGLTKEELSKEQLEAYIVHLQGELDRAKEERVYFQLSIDRINESREVTDRRLEEAKAELENLDKDKEEDERRQQEEIKAYEQKMKQLVCEHQNTISKMKADGLAAAEKAQEEQEQLEPELHKDMRSIMADIQELDDKNLFKELNLRHDEEMTKARDRWEKHLAEIHAKNERKHELMQQELDKIRKKAFIQRQDDWNKHIDALVEDRDEAFAEAKEVHDGAAEEAQEYMHMKDSLKRQTDTKKLEQKEKEKNLARVLQENKRLMELCSNAEQKIAENQKKISFYNTKRDANERAKRKELKTLTRDCEALAQKLSELQLERDELHETRAQRVEQVKRDSGVRVSRLERKLRDVTDGLEKTEAQNRSALAACRMDPAALAVIRNRTQTILDSMNNSIRNLQNKKAQITRANKDLQLIYETNEGAHGPTRTEPCGVVGRPSGGVSLQKSCNKTGIFNTGVHLNKIKY